MFQKSLIAGIVALSLGFSTLAFAENVFVTPKGKKFHKAACELIKKSQLTELDIAQAGEQGYKPCGKCYKVEKAPEGQQAETGK